MLQNKENTSSKSNLDIKEYLPSFNKLRPNHDGHLNLISLSKIFPLAKKIVV